MEERRKINRVTFTVFRAADACALSFSNEEQTEKEREREKKKKTISQSSPRTSPRPFSFIYTWNPPSSGFLALVCNKTRETKGILASRFREKECALSPLSERERSEKRTAGLINTRPAHVPASTNRIESVAETPHHHSFSRELYTNLAVVTPDHHGRWFRGVLHHAG